jgi:hypothetical protein
MSTSPRIDLVRVRAAHALRVAARLRTQSTPARTAFLARGGKLEGNKAS